MRFPNFRRSGKSVTTEQKSKHILGNEGIWALVLGAITFIVVRFGGYTSADAPIGRNEGIFVWPLILEMITGFLLLVVANLFCIRNERGLLELSDKHVWVRSFGIIAGGIFFFCMGWLFVFGVTLWLSTLRT